MPPQSRFIRGLFSRQSACPTKQPLPDGRGSDLEPPYLFDRIAPVEP